MNENVRIGFVGCGDISGIYLQNLTSLFKGVEIIGVCDLVREKAEKAREKYNIPKIYTDMYEMFADPEVDIVLNITRPAEHYGVTKAALEAGKNVYSEKPLGITIEQGMELVALAEKKGLLLGGAPDTFMGAGLQTVREIIESGEIGTPIGAAGFMICRGHETWHPDPEFYYTEGGGPLLDMGPYYVTALVNILGEASAVSAMTKKSFNTRTITSQPHNGEVINVTADTYVSGLIRFESGAIASLFTTFDCHYPFQARFEVYGTEGTMFVPDPNWFAGGIKVFKNGEEKEFPMTFGYSENSRGLGLTDMAMALRSGREFRCNCEQTLHVLEIMDGLITSGKEGKEIKINSHYKKRASMVKGLPDGTLEV